MAKMRPCQTLESSRLKKYSHRVASLAGEKYDGISVVREVKVQGCKSSKEVQKYLHNLITDNASSPALNPNIQSVADALMNEAAKQYPEEFSPEARAVVRQLILSNITEESLPEIKASKIHVSDSGAVSHKFYNICFHIPGVLAILSEWILIGEIRKEDFLKYAVMLWNSINQLYGLSEATFGATSAAVLQEWYKAPKNHGGVNEADLINRVIDKYSSQIPDLNEACVMEAIETLRKYHCVDLSDGFLYVKESIVLE